LKHNETFLGKIMDFEVDYDVVVAGGGIAGVAAALESARAGMKTALLEKTVLLGGLATTGLVYIYLPLCDGNGTQVSFGITEELLLASLKYGPGDVPDNWKNEKNAEEAKRYRIIFSPASFIIAMDELLEEAGVDIWLDTLVCKPQLNGEELTGLEVENKSGRGLINGKSFIDATGDADIAFRAGAPCADGKNYLSVWALSNPKDADSGLNMTITGAWANGNNMPPGSRIYEGIDGEQVSNFIVEGRKLLRKYYVEAWKKEGKNRNNFYPMKVPAMPQFRTTRRIIGDTIMQSEEDGLGREDSVGLVADWRCAGKVWEIPYSALVPQKIKNLLVAGRCISSKDDAWEVTRVIPAAALTGQVAAKAATLSIKGNVSPEKLSVSELQKALRADKFPIHLADVGL
jgi:hypothetical protein